MAEILGIVSGAVSLVGFAGQLAQSAVFLYTFINSIKDAPDDLRRISGELQNIESILNRIPSTFTGKNAGIGEALTHCENCLRELLELQKKTALGPHARRRQIFWAQLKFSLNRSDLAKHLGNLERAKLMLHQACNIEIRDEQNTHLSLLQAHQASLTNIASLHQASADTILATKTVVDEIKATSLENKNSSARASHDATEIHKRVGEMLDGMHQLLDASEKAQLASHLTQSLVRNATTLIQSSTQSTQAMFHEVLVQQPRILLGIQGQIDRAVHETLDLHHRQHAKHLGQNIATSPSAASQKTFTGHGIDVPERLKAITKRVSVAANRWIKRSSWTSQRCLFQNVIFGTLSVTTTTTIYTRTQRLNPDEEQKKKISTTTIQFFPASYLTSRGVVVCRQAQQSIIGAKIKQISPHWSLSTVNIVPRDSKIIDACLDLNLAIIQKLFDDNQASPYDMDDGGRNLLGWVSIGLERLEQCQDIKSRLDDLGAIFDLLLGLGVDSGLLDLDEYVPSMIFSTIWGKFSQFHPAFSEYDDYLEYLFAKLICSALSDPFTICDEALISVSTSCEYLVRKFPGILGIYIMNGCETDAQETIAPLALELLLSHEEYMVSWSSRQLEEICTIGPYRFWTTTLTVEDARSHVSFWVTSRHEQVDKYLTTKLTLMKKFLVLHAESLIFGNDFCILDTISRTLFETAEVIALLTEQTYGDNDTPWVRHRFRKLCLIQAWLLEVLKELLAGNRFLLTKVTSMDELVKRYNARTASIWFKAVENLPLEAARSNRDKLSFTEELNRPQDYESDWETEGSQDGESDWETEEEWEEGFMLNAAVDRLDVDSQNPQYPRTKDRTCSSDFKMKDYEESYWEHVYPRVISPRGS